MPEVVKTCKKHGHLTIDQVRQEKTVTSFMLRCKLCREEQAEKNKEKRLAYSREYEKRRPKRQYTGEYAERVRGYSKEWRRKNSEAVNARVAEKRKQNPEIFREYDRKWRKENIERAQIKDIVNKYKITYEQYLMMSEQQQGLCAICNNKESRKSKTEGKVCRLVVDHCHKTGRMRKLLCSSCNCMIGFAKDNVDFLRRAIKYLEQHNYE